MISILMMLMLAAQDPAPAAVAPVEPGAVEAATEAPAALPVQTVRPVETNSEAGQAAGHAGSVIVEIDMQPDGTKSMARIAESSRSGILDAEALALINGATLRSPATATRYRIEVEFQPYGFLEMKCSSLVRQTRWFEATWPEKSIKDTTLYTASVGMIALVAMNGGAGGADAVRAGGRVEAVWPRLVTECERQPHRLYIQVLGGLLR